MPSGSQPWLGKWESSDKPAVNWDVIAGVFGMHGDKCGSGNVKSTMEVVRDGDTYTTTIDVPEFKHHAVMKFKLGEEGTHTREGHEIKYKFTEDGPKLLGEIKLPAKNKVIYDTYEVNGNELVKICKVDGTEGRKYFKRV